MTDIRLQGSALPKSVIKDHSLDALVKRFRPAKPLYIVDLAAMTRAAQDFCAAFPGTPLFAVKTNPDPQVLQAIARGGVKAFDVASLEEIKLVARAVPGAEMHFMHPVKAPEDIHAAYHEYGVRHFVLDHEDELFKIMRETDLAQDLNLTVRITLPRNESAAIDLSAKFGASFEEAVALLQKCRPVSRRLSVSFHVGTQNIDPARYGFAIAHVARLVDAAQVPLDVVNVGGGFPVSYVDQPHVPGVQTCVETLTHALDAYGLTGVDLLAEPGRVLVASGAYLVARVELRKGDLLYINDGVYGGLFDAARWVQTQFPVHGVSCDRPFNGQMQAYRLAGPTCDSLDMMQGPFALPADIGMGDWVVFSQVGAYSQCMRSNFNGFGEAQCVYLSE